MKYHPVGCGSVKAIIDHEIGHQIDNLLNISAREDIQKLYESMTTEEMTNNISMYSWRNQNKKGREMVAEAWSEYMNNPEPREVSLKIGKIIEEAYIKWLKEK